MAIEITAVKQPIWTPLADEGCINVAYKSLLKRGHLALAMLRFSQNATIHEHPADINIDVICLEGHGFTSVGGEQSALHAGQRVHWPAGRPHRLWTQDSEMVTLMVEHIVE